MSTSLKTESVSVRVEPQIKEALQIAAEREMRSLANMVEVMVVAYCRANGYPLAGVPALKRPCPPPSSGSRREFS